MPSLSSNWKFESITAGHQAAPLVPGVLDAWKSADARRAWELVAGAPTGLSCVARLTIDSEDLLAPTQLQQACAAAGLRHSHYPG